MPQFRIRFSLCKIDNEGNPLEETRKRYEETFEAKDESDAIDKVKRAHSQGMIAAYIEEVTLIE